MGKHTFNRYDINHNTSPHTEHMIYVFIKQELVNRVKGYGGRFLTKVSDGLWHEMDDGDARKKASQGKVNNPTTLLEMLMNE